LSLFRRGSLVGHCEERFYQFVCLGISRVTILNRIKALRAALARSSFWRRFNMSGASGVVGGVIFAQIVF